MGILMPRITQAKQILKRSFSNGSSTTKSMDIPKGCLAVYVGEQEKKRFVVPIWLLMQPTFQQLLDQAEEEFGNRTVLRQGRGSFGSNPLGTGRGVGKGFDSWRNAEPKSFKHRWVSIRLKDRDTIGILNKNRRIKVGMNLMKEVTVAIGCLDSPRWSFRCMRARMTHSNGHISVRTSSKNNKHRRRLGSTKQLSPYRAGQTGSTET
ncbi:uncharacterized protein LOC128127560 [Lactuca sativa]|uniref:uncharacterized protein LOC128127560 n=1 Tax=Lactuca sativa TaxID=4236 RepID=UPI0022B0254E|nr:uncharacterized protein LOC128127560 [Lactuca sativa]